MWRYSNGSSSSFLSAEVPSLCGDYNMMFLFHTTLRNLNHLIKIISFPPEYKLSPVVYLLTWKTANDSANSHLRNILGGEGDVLLYDITWLRSHQLTQLPLCCWVSHSVPMGLDSSHQGNEITSLNTQASHQITQVVKFSNIFFIEINAASLAWSLLVTREP